MRKLSLILFVLLVLVGCGEDSEEITEENTEPIDEFIGKWHVKSMNGKPIDDFYKELAIAIFNEELLDDEELEELLDDEELEELIDAIDIETNWDKCCSIDAEMWINFKSDGTYESYYKTNTVIDWTKLLDDPDEDLETEIDEETETGTYFITEATFKTIPNASAEDIVNDDQAEIEEGNWRISDDGKSLTLTTEYEDGTALTYICTKNK